MNVSAYLKDAINDDGIAILAEFKACIQHAADRLGRPPMNDEMEWIWRMVQTHHGIPEEEQTSARWRLH
nr:hypothetical protein [uncultured Shinella sp.]